MLALLILMALFLAYGNGANDNFKGVASLYGSNVVSYRTAITLATIATFAGCLVSLFVAAELVKAFSGKGIVPDEIAASPVFLTAVAAGAGGAVMLATVTGFPVSTTHGLTGALVGAGLVAVGAQLNFNRVGFSFFGPLLVSPVLAIGLTAALYVILKAAAARLAITKETCVCIGAVQVVAANPLRSNPAVEQFTIVLPPEMASPILMSSRRDCMAMDRGHLLVAPVQKFTDYMHYVSAGAVSFARGLNDAPKIAALLVVVQAVDIQFHVLAIAIVMATGGLLSARKVAHVMSKRICCMEEGQALTANLVTAFLVIFASRLGLPVSTTHVSVGAITGTGLINGTANAAVIYGILASWLFTLPIAAVISGVVYVALQRVG